MSLPVNRAKTTKSSRLSFISALCCASGLEEWSSNPLCSTRDCRSFRLYQRTDSFAIFSKENFVYTSVQHQTKDNLHHLNWQHWQCHIDWVEHIVLLLPPLLSRKSPQVAPTLLTLLSRFPKGCPALLLTKPVVLICLCSITAFPFVHKNEFDAHTE